MTLSVRLVLAVLFLSQLVIAQPLKKGQAVVTHFSGMDDHFFMPKNDYVLSVVDLRGYTHGVQGKNWMAPISHPSTIDSLSWKSDTLGQVFGVTIDATGNIYVAATNVYFGMASFGTAGPGGIYKIKNSDWSVSKFVTTAAASSSTSTTKIPNTGCGLGNICYDKWNNQLFVTNFEDGMIYRLDMNGNILSKFDPFAADNGTAGVVDLGERIWGINVNLESNNTVRVYFSRWVEDESMNNPAPGVFNSVWSVALDAATGDFSGTEQQEVKIEDLLSQSFFDYSNPVSDISFSSDGRMLLAERTMWDMSTSAHNSRVMEYTGGSQLWVGPQMFFIGNYDSGGGKYTNAAGGVDYGFSTYDPSTGITSGFGEMVWATGDALRYISNNPDGVDDYVYGLQGTSYTGNSDVPSSPDYVRTSSYYIDLNHNVQDAPKMQQGAAEICRDCEEGKEEIECLLLNIFTPNGDGINDKLTFDCIWGKGWKLEIFNRWGNSIYETNDYDNTWTASNVSDGVYYYVLTQADENNKYTGFVHIVR